MIKRFNRLAIDLPIPEYGDANAAAAVQELLGGKFGEMSTLNNYMYQSFNFRQKTKFKPFYDLVSSITAEEFGHALPEEKIVGVFRDTIFRSLIK